MARTSLRRARSLLLLLIGFCIFGPQVLLVGTAPADLARRGTAAAAAGFVNFMGYMGAFAGDLVTGYLVDRITTGRPAIYCLGRRAPSPARRGRGLLVEREPRRDRANESHHHRRRPRHDG